MRISDWSSDVCSSDLAKVDTDKNQFIAAQFQIKSIPTVYAMFQGQLVADLTQARTESQLKAMLDQRSEEHTSELQSLMRNSYAVFCLKKKRQEYKPDMLTDNIQQYNKETQQN